MNFTKTILEGIKNWAEKKFAKVEKDLANKQPAGDYVLKSKISEITVTSIDGKTGDVTTNIEDKLDKENPVGTGYFSMNRRTNSVIGSNSHAEGNSNIASGYGSHAEGGYTEATGIYSHAEGEYTEATGDYSHAEGTRNKATGNYSHAEGGYTKATGNSSHAEGHYTEATGYCSHVEGGNTVASGRMQHVQGKFNIEDAENKYAHIVGNGTSGGIFRSNAHTLDWEGMGWFAGGLKVGGTGQDDESAVEVALKTDIPEITVTSVNGMTGDIIIENNKQLTAMSSLITQELSDTLAIADLAGVITEQYQHINIYNDTKYHMINIKYSGGSIGLFGSEGYISIYVKSYTDSNNARLILSTDHMHYDVAVINGTFSQTPYYYVDENKVLLKGNNVEYIPTTDYSPTTKKYVDDSTADKISTPSVIAAGQTIIVKTVDENGKPVEWEAVDPWVITSSTEGSTKKFKLTINDDGILTIAEIVNEE